jgi:hypothetical protein
VVLPLPSEVVQVLLPALWLAEWQWGLWAMGLKQVRFRGQTVLEAGHSSISLIYFDLKHVF